MKFRSAVASAFSFKIMLLSAVLTNIPVLTTTCSAVVKLHSAAASRFSLDIVTESCSRHRKQLSTSYSAERSFHSTVGLTFCLDIVIDSCRKQPTVMLITLFAAKHILGTYCSYLKIMIYVELSEHLQII